MVVVFLSTRDSRSICLSMLWEGGWELAWARPHPTPPHALNAMSLTPPYSTLPAPSLLRIDMLSPHLEHTDPNVASRPLTKPACFYSVTPTLLLPDEIS